MNPLPLPKSTFVRRYLVVMSVLTVAAILASLALRSGVRARADRGQGGFADPADAPLGRIEGFRLTDQTGAAFGSQDLAGRFYVVDFVFTSCAGVCPIMTAEMAKLFREYRDDDRVRFVSITVDPETDTPERLAEFAARYGATPDRWSFLTGPIEEIESIAREQFLIGNGGEPINHSNRFVLVDGGGEIRGYYDGTDHESLEVLRADLAGRLTAAASQR